MSRVQQGRSALIVRGHFESDKLSDLAAKLHAPEHWDVIIGTSEANGPMKVGPYPQLLCDVDALRSMGFQVDTEKFFYDFGDVVLYYAQRQLPGYEYYVLIEHDVDFTGDAVAFMSELLANMREQELDMAGPRVEPQGPWWSPHWQLARQVYPEVWSVFLPVVAVSARAATYLYERRIAEGPATASFGERVFCEAFVASALKAAQFSIAELNDVVPHAYSHESFYYGAPMLAGTEPCRRSEVQALHPVYPAREFLRTHLHHAHATGTLLQYAAALRSGENLYPDDVRREYLTYAEKALTEHTPPTASEAPRSELPPVVILPRRPEWPRSGIAALAQPESELLGNRSIMQHLVESLAGSGVQEIYIPEGAAVSESPGIRHVRYPERLADGTNLSALADLVGDRRVLLCYGDCLADVDLPRLLAMHLAASKQATVISARPSPLLLALTGDIVPVRHDRPHLGNGGGVNGGYTVLEPRALRGAEHGHALAAVLEHLLDDDQLTVYRHTGFWEAVRTRPVLNALNQLWFDGRAPWVTGKRTPPHAAALPADELAQKDDLFGA